MNLTRKQEEKLIQIGLNVLLGNEQTEESDSNNGKQSRRRMTAKEKEAVSKRMKKYWRERRKHS